MTEDGSHNDMRPSGAMWKNPDTTGSHDSSKMAARELVREVVFDTKGKGYVAANTIDRGVIVLEEKPFAFAVHDGMVEKVCHECLVR